MRGRNELAPGGWSFPEPRRRSRSGDGALTTIRTIAGAASSLHPASFTLVMATGSVSLAASMLGMASIATLLFWLNLGAFSFLWLIALSRLFQSSRGFFSDLFDSIRGPAFFTAVAATAMIGNQFILVMDNSLAGLAWWFAALFVWMCLAQLGFGGQPLAEPDADVPEQNNGGWGIAIAATQSVATPSALLALCLSGDRPELLAFALALAVVANAAHVSLLAITVYRSGFASISLATLSRSFALLFWTTGMWWLPARAAIGLSGRLYRRFPLTNPVHLGAVFALTTYAICLTRLATVIDLPFSVLIGRLVISIALLAWSGVLFGLIRGILRRLWGALAPAPDASNGNMAPESGSAL
ncbi:MAG: hypothetical protein HYX94_04340 [Chloroflexi bacterium]|nr:hypothetical protein [Chloroflexota bacterium]